MAEKLSAVKGMNDILPASVPRTEKLPDSALWQWFEGAVRGVLGRYGYQYLLTPIVEPTQLFVRGLGEVTDIVEKEMYSFTDSMNGDRLTLRPEATAGIVRAMIEHNALYNGPLRIWTLGPMFRHERPQKGRYRQFHQLDVEALGFAGPDVDAEMILMARALWRELGLVEGSHVRLEINSLGQPDERRAHRQALVQHFEQNADALDEDARRRLHSNPLRILDSKNPQMQPLIERAPRLMDFLGAESRAHFDAVCAALDAVGLAFRVNPRLVRGMDYYNLTVFEWVTDQLGSQGTVCGGGRYDGLIAQLGGKPAPAVGFGLGIERLLLLVQELGLPVPSGAPDAYAIVPAGTPLAPVVVALETLRAAGLRVVQHAGGTEGPGSMKSQFKKADASGARHALIFGADELAAGEVTVKSLRDGGGAQSRRPLAAVADWAAALKG
ncbi:histidine--tRNA ligase [Ramlibacter tataouinensis]|uniref:Histidine--tRNA ligase n=1 Tax=Ramlibacter tataouinensis (strain ATCC BAA-407 / DSM 14655 / LMG 21543 / TTB310) TaxID=365046 RepID=F5XX42_RAMTT|nr:histidine--tRNA ligase [Ramlibacter tataouinensis]AEG92986.1 candidate histidyl-tRNA synthetase (Histidine--tRNA ligase) [Ramlibacter tataouinensis TTB310]